MTSKLPQLITIITMLAIVTNAASTTIITTTSTITNTRLIAISTITRAVIANTTVDGRSFTQPITGWGGPAPLGP